MGWKVVCIEKKEVSVHYIIFIQNMRLLLRWYVGEESISDMRVKISIEFWVAEPSLPYDLGKTINY